MKIGILQTGHVADDLQPDNGNYPEIFAKFLGDQGFAFDTYAVVDDDFPTGPDAADGWLITGSRFGVYEGLAWIVKLEELVRDIYARGVPMVGVCFGHQVIAQALGGRVEKFDGGWAVGPHEYDMGGETITLNAWHQDQVVEPPKDAKVVGTNDFCANAALLYGQKAFTIQPHPEITQQYIQGLLETRAPGVVPEDIRTSALNRLDVTTDSARVARLIGTFFREKRIV